jgi:hypothetical protein
MTCGKRYIDMRGTNQPIVIFFMRWFPKPYTLGHGTQGDKVMFPGTVDSLSGSMLRTKKWFQTPRPSFYHSPPKTGRDLKKREPLEPPKPTGTSTLI